MSHKDNTGLHIPHDIGLFLTIFTLSLLVVGSMTWVYLSPRPSEQFLSLGLLGEDMMAEHYFPGNASRIALGDLVKWHITLYNHMGSVQYVALRVKLLNLTMPPPNDRVHMASPAPYYKEMRRVLVDNETWVLNFYWGIENTTISNKSICITTLRVNNVTIHEGLNASSLHGYNFRMVFELWTYINQTAGFVYGWKSGEEIQTAWLQVWFNVTTPASAVAGGAIGKSPGCLIPTTSNINMAEMFTYSGLDRPVLPIPLLLPKREPTDSTNLIDFSL